MASEIGKPVSHAGAGKSTMRPAAMVEAMKQVGTNRLFAATNPTEMGDGAHGDDVVTTEAAPALLIKAVGKAIEA